MENFVLDIICQTASFRDPNFQNFHKSLTLPPPTTVIGLAGAALGLSPLGAQEFFENSDFRIGVWGIFMGKSTDTWKYNKHASQSMRTYDPGLDGSIIQREYLIYPRFKIGFFSKNEELVQQLKSAFENPVYALTMGNSDSLAEIRKIETGVPVIQSNKAENCIVEGNVVDKVMAKAEEGELQFSVYSNENLIYDLPMRFNYENDYGRRTVLAIKGFTFLGDEMKLNFNLTGLLSSSNQFIPLFDL